MREATFERSVFINCPFDDDYTPLLEAILFCIIDLGFFPRLAKERMDSVENRLNKIREMIEQSKYSIHDLSRCQANASGEFYRLNMPFELGIDYGCKLYFGDSRDQKRILIMEEQQHRYKAALSDLAGCDIQVHAGDVEKALRKVRNWLVSEANAKPDAAAKIMGRYIKFQEWHYEKQLSDGFSEDDVKDYPTKELMEAMGEWVRLGRPV